MEPYYALKNVDYIMNDVRGHNNFVPCLSSFSVFQGTIQIKNTALGKRAIFLKILSKLENGKYKERDPFGSAFF